MLSRYLRKDGSYWYEADYKEIDKSEVVRLLREFGINPDNLLIIMHQGMIEELGAISHPAAPHDGRGGRGFPRVQGEDLPVRGRPQEHGQRGGLAHPAHRQREPDDRVLEADLRQIPREEEAPGAQGAPRARAALGAGGEALRVGRSRSRRGSTGSARRSPTSRTSRRRREASRRRTDRPLATGRWSSGSSTGRSSGRRGSAPADEGARDAMEKLRNELETIKKDLGSSLNSGAALDPKKVEAPQGVHRLLFAEVQGSDSEEAAQEEDRARQGGRLAPGGAGRRRGRDQEDHGRVHLSAGEVRGPRVQDQGHRVGDKGAREVREGGQWRSSTR